MFRELEFQSKVLKKLEIYIDSLIKQKRDIELVAEKITEMRSGDSNSLNFSMYDFTKETWELMKRENYLPASRLGVPFSVRKDGIGNSVPNVTLKVPTGGGKTWLAVKSASMILNKYLVRNTGFILWLVPNEAIYSQTLKNFKIGIILTDMR